MSTQYSGKQKNVSQKVPDDNQKKYKYICNCKKCNGKEVTAKTQVKHANNKDYWDTKKLRKHQLKEIEARKSRYVTEREKKRKRDSEQLLPSETLETTKIPKLKKDISVSDMLTELNLAPNILDENNEEVAESSSKKWYDQFHDPPSDDIPDIIDEDNLYDIGGGNDELIDDLNEISSNDIDEGIDSENEDADNDDSKDEDTNNEDSEDEDSNNEDNDTDNGDSEDEDIDIGNENLFTAPEIEDEKYKYIEIEDKLEMEVLLWLFKFQQKYRVPDVALEALIKFLNSTFKLINNSKLKEFPASLFLAKRKLGIFQPKLKMAVCTSCHKLYDSKIICNFKKDNKLAVMNCCYEEFPNSSKKNKCNNELSTLKKNKNSIVAVPHMLYPKPSIKQQLSIMYQRPNFEKNFALSGIRNNDNNYYTDIYDGNIWKTFPFDGSKFFNSKNVTSNLGLLLNLN